MKTMETRHMVEPQRDTLARRWGSALTGSILAAVSLPLSLSFAPLYGIVILAMGLLQVVEFAPGGPANKP
jgi:hypothetical protein